MFNKWKECPGETKKICNMAGEMQTELKGVKRKLKSTLQKEAQTSGKTFSKFIKRRKSGSDCVGLLGDQGSKSGYLMGVIKPSQIRSVNSLYVTAKDVLL